MYRVKAIIPVDGAEVTSEESNVVWPWVCSSGPDAQQNSAVEKAHLRAKTEQY